MSTGHRGGAVVVGLTALTSPGKEINIMTIRERAAAAVVRAREAGIAVPATEPPYRQRLRAALARDLATLLAVPAGQIVVSNDLIRARGGVPGQLITVQDLDDAHDGLRFIPETGNTGTGGGAAANDGAVAARAVGSIAAERALPAGRPGPRHFPTEQGA